MFLVGIVASSVASAVAPSAPQSFTATAASSSSINLSWAAPASNGGAAITSYTLKRGATTIYTGPNTSFSDTGLSAATAYSYTVLATNLAGDGPTASASATTSATTPSAPQSFSASAASSSSINLSWAAPASNGGAAISSYTLKRGATTIYTGVGTSFTDTGLAGSTNYSYTVLATNSAGNGPTASANATTPSSASPPDAPYLSATVYSEGPVYDEYGENLIGYFRTYQITISHGNNNGSAVSVTKYESDYGSGWYTEDLYPPNNNTKYATFGQGESGSFRAYDVNSAGNGAMSNQLNLGY